MHPRAILLCCVLFLTMGRGSAQSLDSLMQIVNSGKIDSSYFYAAGKLSTYYRGKDFEKTLYYLKLVIRHLEADPNAGARAYVSLGLTHADNGAFDSADYCFSKAREVMARLPQDPGLTSTYHNGCGLLARRKGDNAAALEHFKAVDALGEAGVSLENRAGNLLNIANTYNRMGDNRESLRYLFKALPMFEKAGNRKGMAYCYNALGQSLKIQGNLSEAEKHFRKSLKLKEQDSDMKGIANTSNDIALLLVDLKKLDEALKYIDRSIAIAEEVGIQEVYVMALINKGKILRLQGRLEEAQLIFDKAKPIAEQHPSAFLLSGLQSEMGKLYLEKKQNSEAITQLVSSIREAENSHNMEAKLNAHLFLSQTYVKSGDYRKAHEEFQKYHMLADSLRGRKLKLEFKSLETQYEVDKKNAEIALLRKDQELQARTVERQRAVQTGIGIALLSVIIISALLVNRYRTLSRAKRLLEVERVRNSIARDLHDDIGSTISSINIVSQVALQRGAAVNEDHLRKISEQSASIMERMSDIVWSINPHNDSLPMLIAKMKEFGSEILEPKNISYDVFSDESANDLAINVDHRKNVFLIFKEALNNAAKYSDATEVRVEVRRRENALVLEIIDNGKGFDLPAGGTGNGLRNMHSRAASINGDLLVVSAPGKGTRVTLTFAIT